MLGHTSNVYLAKKRSSPQLPFEQAVSHKKYQAQNESRSQSGINVKDFSNMERIRLSTLRLEDENNSVYEAKWATDRSPEQNLIVRVRQLEEDNHKLQTQYVRLSEKYTNLTEEYITLNSKLQQQVNQSSIDHRRQLRQKPASTEKRQIDFTQILKSVRLLPKPKNTKKFIQYIRSSVTKLSRELLSLQRETRTTIQNIKTQVVSTIEGVQLIHLRQIDALKTELSQTIQQQHLINIARENDIADVTQLEAKIEKLLWEKDQQQLFLRAVKAYLTPDKLRQCMNGLSQEAQTFIQKCLFK